MKTAAAAWLLFCATLCSASPVSVSILSLLSPGHVEITLKQQGVCLLGSAGDAPPASRAVRPGETITLEASGNLLLMNRDGKAAADAAFHCPGGCTARIRTTGQDRLYHGDLKLRSDHNTIEIVLQIDSEELAASVLQSENGGRARPAAAEALAVVIRSFIAAGPRHTGYDFCDTTHCEVFQGFSPEKAAGEATRQTAGLVLQYRGQTFRPYFSRSCGGRTSTYEEVWGEPSPDYPFPSVDCPCGSLPANAWTTKISLQQLALAAGLPGAVPRRNGDWIEVASGETVHRYSPENFRTLLGRAEGWKILPGNRFDFRIDRGSCIFSGKGRGHGVGFCQSGAEILAASGNDFHGILRTYFPGADVQLQRP